MADSNITKKALAGALKTLMQEQSFEKITVANICEKCDMNRKSFYYHFRDKYDLINWIFDTDFAAITDKYGDDNWVMLRKTCTYLYENHCFYRKALGISGQNSFQEHFKEKVRPLIEHSFSEMFPEGDDWSFQIGILTDTLLIAFKHWLTAREPMTDKEFLEQCKLGIQFTSGKIKEFEQRGIM